MGSQLTANDGGLLCTTHCEVIEDIRQVVTEMVPVRSVEVNSPINIEENQKSCAVIENAEDAQALSEKQESSPSISGGTTSIDISSSITSSLDSGGTSFISSQVLTALYLGSSTPLPTSILISTPTQLNPTPTSGGNFDRRIICGQSEYFFRSFYHAVVATAHRHWSTSFITSADGELLLDRRLRLHFISFAGEHRGQPRQPGPWIRPLRRRS